VLVPPVRRQWENWTRDAAALSAFAMGVFGGGFATGLLLFLSSGLVQWMPISVRLFVTATVAAFLFVHEARWVDLRLPKQKLTRMIPPERFSPSFLRGMGVFGFELGLGFRTYIPHVGPYVIALLILLWAGSPIAIVIAALGWAIGRTVPLVARIAAAKTRGDRVTLHAQGIAESLRIDSMVRFAAGHISLLFPGGVAAAALASLII
jgi:hypothetical protein